MKNKNQKIKSKIREKIHKIYEENEYANLIQNKNRSRSITVGTAFGGIVEISMRGDYHSLWSSLQPVEVVELIEQLASGIGLQVAMRPKQDFASWRGWNADADDRYWSGTAPWQIEHSSETHRALLQEQKSNDTMSSKSDDIESKKDDDLQEQIQKDLIKSSTENLKKLRKEVDENVDEFNDCLKEELENFNNNE